MGLSSTRKLLSVLMSIIIAAATAAFITTLVLNTTVTSVPYLEKTVITDELIAECDAQLDAKYKALELESGIPSRVFETVKNDYAVEDSLTRALQNVFGEEDSSLYNNNIVSYFERLCTEYLKGSDISYSKADVRATADKAALIFSETVGIHNVDSVMSRNADLKKFCTRLSLASLITMIVLLVALILIYTDVSNAYSYLFCGFAAGSLASLVGSAVCLAAKVWNRVETTPAVFDEALGGSLRTSLLLLALASLIIFAVTYAVMVYFYRKAHKSSD